ncbi:MAG: beta-galactosidase [Eubacteriales bacterium]
MMERLKKTGSVAAKKSADVKTSRFGIGFEKLDRNVFDPSKAYDKIAATGVKWARIQSGWARTETEKGVYHWEWIDDIIDNLYRRGLEVWVCLCYGNALYSEGAEKVFGAVGIPPIFTDEEKRAWADYVSAFAERYAGKVTWFEVWNEPDGKWCWKHGPSGREYGQFVIDTSKAVKRGNPEAKIIGGSAWMREMTFLDEAFRVGMGDAVDALTFHEYTADESMVADRVSNLRALCDKYKPGIEIIQGESGSQSRSGGHGALRSGSWTERKQAKQLLRHAMADMLADVKFSSYFSCMDMIEALGGTVGNVNSYLDYGYFGVLGAAFDENGFAVGEYAPKPSYYALCNVASVFADDFRRAALPIRRCVEASPRVFGNDATLERDFIGGGFSRSDGSCAYVYWRSTDLMTTDYDGTASFEIASECLPRLIDLFDGSVYEIPENMIERKSEGVYEIKNLPLRDYPLVLVFGEFYR